ncbi:hypothetical protein AVEN_2563-1 [Araneus ventricosus]|uniref:Uncharacterized protein n=1 Tax=Araneus ventricosus TaxID=182803 RepID=A0A4Y2GQJ4_ARAVE|nr:hypothetical protein AVEN_2563-1 [Araneus ventricosus]
MCKRAHLPSGKLTTLPVRHSTSENYVESSYEAFVDENVSFAVGATTETRTSMEDDEFSERKVFSDESTFHISGIMNKNNIRILCIHHPHVILQYEGEFASCVLHNSPCKDLKTIFSLLKAP